MPKLQRKDEKTNLFVKNLPNLPLFKLQEKLEEVFGNYGNFSINFIFFFILNLFFLKKKQT